MEGGSFFKLCINGNFAFFIDVSILHFHIDIAGKERHTFFKITHPVELCIDNYFPGIINKTPFGVGFKSGQIFGKKPAFVGFIHSKFDFAFFIDKSGIPVFGSYQCKTIRKISCIFIHGVYDIFAI
ncbi:MAG: hypothetical protein BWY70_00563 [Bacteroidetes bacterium ADurb.Bin408]|nr:MAG: hypothetical protein BWY70_00563 [Bacteroidetes bacterium ADurb.Bin408]